MVISDLNYLETVSETSSILGGDHKKSYIKYSKKSTAIAANIAKVSQTAVAVAEKGGTAVAANVALVNQAAVALAR